MSGQSESVQPVANGMAVGKACFCVAIFFSLLLLCNGVAM